MINKYFILGTIIIFIILYVIYIQNLQDNTCFFTLTIYLLILIGILIYKLCVREKEYFTSPEIVINVSGHDNYRKDYYIQINDEMIWQNLSPFRHKIVGDLFGTVPMRPGERFTYQYNVPGIFKFYIDKCDDVRYVHVEPPKFGLLADYNNDQYVGNNIENNIM